MAVSEAFYWIVEARLQLFRNMPTKYDFMTSRKGLKTLDELRIHFRLSVRSAVQSVAGLPNLSHRLLHSVAAGNSVFACQSAGAKVCRGLRSTPRTPRKSNIWLRL